MFSELFAFFTEMETAEEITSILAKAHTKLTEIETAHSEIIAEKNALEEKNLILKKSNGELLNMIQLQNKPKTEETETEETTEEPTEIEDIVKDIFNI